MAWNVLSLLNFGDFITETYLNYIKGNFDALSGHTHNNSAGDGSSSLGPLAKVDFTDAVAPAAPGAGKTRMYSVSGELHARAGAAGADRTLFLKDANGNWKQFFSNGSGVMTEVALDVIGTAMVSNGSSAAPTMQSVPVILARTATLVVSNSAAENNILSVTVPGGTLSTNRILRFKCQGLITYNNNTADTLSMKMNWGGSNTFSIAHKPAGALSANNIPFHLEVTLAADGATNQQRASILMLVGAAASIPYLIGNGDVGTPFGSFAQSGALAAKDSTANQTLQVSFQWSAANTNNAISVYPGVLKVL